MLIKYSIGLALWAISSVSYGNESFRPQKINQNDRLSSIADSLMAKERDGGTMQSPFASNKNPYTVISKGRYLTGALISTVANTSLGFFLFYKSSGGNLSPRVHSALNTYILGSHILGGFGIARAIQGKPWWPLGFGWSIVDIGSVLLTGFTCLNDGAGKILNNISPRKACYYGMLGSGIVLLGFRLWQVIDAWSLPPSYRITKRKWNVVPKIAYNDQSKSLKYSLAFRYKIN